MSERCRPLSHCPHCCTELPERLLTNAGWTRVKRSGCPECAPAAHGVRKHAA